MSSTPTLDTCASCSGRGVGLVAPGAASCAHCAHVATGAPFYRPPPGHGGGGRGGCCSLTGVAWLVALFAALIMLADERRVFGGRANPHARAELRGRVALVTGVSPHGIGLETAAQLAAQGATVVVSGRDRGRLGEATRVVAAAAARGAAGGAADATLPLLDLANFSSVRAFAAAALAAHPRIDVLVLNAGVMAVPTLERTADGLERTFGVNHVGHQLLTSLLMPALERSAAATGDARVIVVASGAARGGDLSPTSAAMRDMNYSKGRAYGFIGGPEYCNSKLANCVFAAELARRAEGSGLRAYSLHPGAVHTPLFKHVPGFGFIERVARPLLRALLKTPREGAQTTLFLATAPLAELANGGYYDDCQHVTGMMLHPQVADRAVGKALWEATEQIIKSVAP
jgi:NAD(P)-dependent dehydrogenase (short-subunit alcohol dehydrogenase family)